MKHIAFTGGGSGGHITPIAALIEYGLQDTDIASQCKLFRFGERNSAEERCAKNYIEVTFIPVFCGKLRRYFSFTSVWLNIQDAFLGVIGIIQTAYLLHKYRIDYLFCKGGYVALPVCIAAYIMRVPIALHESDTYAGMTNRLVAKMTHQRFVGFPDVLAPSTCIGQLLSPRLLHPEKSFFNTAEITKPIVLVMGGSQGAGRLFDRLITYLTSRNANEFHFLVLLGSKNSEYGKAFTSYSNVDAYTFIEKSEQMARLYEISDISITRGSATSLAEQHLYNIRKVIVPTPYTGGNHQWHNGVRYRDTYTDTLLEQDENLDKNLTLSLKSNLGYKKSLHESQENSLEQPLHIVRQTILENK